MGDQPHTLLISDLHLHASRPHTTRLLLDFLATTARGAQTLYVLGDLFEYWAGDDDLDDPHHGAVADAFRQLSDAGTGVKLMHGNRDFLLAQAFSARSGATLLDDPFEAYVHGLHVLLTHGDALCTDDIAYQKFRHQVRDPAYQQVFLAQPLAVRKAQIEGYRSQSEMEKSIKAEAIMDVNQQAVLDMLRRHGYPQLLIHGHTHRPDAHLVEVDGHACMRWVLGDWGATGDYLRLDADGCSRHVIAGAAA